MEANGKPEERLFNILEDYLGQDEALGYWTSESESDSVATYTYYYYPDNAPRYQHDQTFRLSHLDTLNDKALRALARDVYARWMRGCSMPTPTRYSF